MDYSHQFDIIVVGGGHAGTEAAMASARMGADTLLLTHNMDTLGQMSCNPAIGGIGKGHLVKEIDALGGLMAKAIDKAGIQFRILNASKGPAVRSTRAQADRFLYKQAVINALQHQDNLTLFQQGVEDLLIEDQTVVGVVTQMGLKFFAKKIILTVGTFLGGRIHIGRSHYQGGRAGDPPANGLSQKLRALPFNVERLKTGTPPRIDGRTIDYSELSVQPGDDPVPVFSFMGKACEHPEQVPCHITYTNEKAHQIIASGMKDSPIYTGLIEGTGPRYCPSIEDKVVRFADKDKHQIFIEPEGLNTTEVYPNGISTSLPFDIQLQFVRAIKGFENAHLTRAGYAIEYDFFDPRDLKASLETRHLEGLYFAGQINGTTGYEEAAAQGLIAGLNAALAVQNKPAWTPARDEAYIGVLIDDLITRGTKEPYRMFTSRAEYRLLLREDNADLRLTAKAHELGLIEPARYQRLQDKIKQMEQELKHIQSIVVQPETEAAKALEVYLDKPLTKAYKLMDLLKRPELTYQKLLAIKAFKLTLTDSQVSEQIEIQAKYAGYIERQAEDIAKLKHYENTKLPQNIDYTKVRGLSAEVTQKLMQVQPQTIGMASRISGITPAAISLLLIHLKKGQLKKQIQEV